jgi:hypothetical protein
MARLRAARTRGELVRQLVFLSVFGFFGLLALATRYERWPALGVGVWLVALWLAGSAWLVWARSTWAKGQREDIIDDPVTVRGVYMRAGFELLFLLGWAFFAAVADAPEWKKALFLAAGVVGLIAIGVKMRRALRAVRRPAS